MGWGFSGAGQNVAVAFTTLKDFKERTSSASKMTSAVNTSMANSTEGETMAVLPPAIDELGTFSGFSLRLQDRANLGMPALLAAQDELMVMAAKNKKFYMVWNEGLPQGDNISLKLTVKSLVHLVLSFLMFQTSFLHQWVQCISMTSLIKDVCNKSLYKLRLNHVCN